MIINQCKKDLCVRLNTNGLICCQCAGYVKKYATEDALRDPEQENAASSSESSLSDFDEDETQDMEL